MLCDSTPDVLVKNRCIDRHRHNIKHRKTSPKNHRCSMHRCFFTSLTQTSSPNRQDLRRLTQTSEIRVPYDEGPMSPRRDVEVSTPIVPCSEYLAGFELVTDTEDDEEERPLFRRSFVASPQQDQTAETIPSRVYVERSRPESARILWSTTREDGNPYSSGRTLSSPYDVAAQSEGGRVSTTPATFSQGVQTSPTREDHPQEVSHQGTQTSDVNLGRNIDVDLHSAAFFITSLHY